MLQEGAGDTCIWGRKATGINGFVFLARDAYTEDKCTPSDEFVQDFDIFLYLHHIHGLLGVEDREWRRWGAILDIAASGLEEPANEEDFEKCIGIFQEFKCGSGLNEFVGVAVKVTLRYGFEVFVKLVSKD